MAKITEAVSCAGKQRHPTREAGLSHLLSLARAGAKRSRLQVYRCGFCKTFHVGHKIRRR
jgi:hypothetical protein